MVKRMDYEEVIRAAKSTIAYIGNLIIGWEQALGGRGESSIIRYY